MLFSILMTVLFGWLFFKCLGFAFRLTWGIVKSGFGRVKSAWRQKKSGL